MTEKQRLALSFLNNTADIDHVGELGIFKFAKYFFPDRFKSPFSRTHYRMMQVYFSMFNPANSLRIERQRYILIHREAAKSTIFSFLVPMYAIYTKNVPIVVSNALLGVNEPGETKIVNDEKFIVIASETSNRAENFVTSIKTEVETNRALLEFFGEKDPRIVEESQDRRKSNKMWRLTSFITKDNTVVWGLGAGQQTRGLNVMGSRPTLWITDDMYSGKNTKTETTRENLNYWFTSEVLNSLDSLSGKVMWLGTMVHFDTVVKDFRALDSWTGVEIAVMGIKELREVVQECSPDGHFQMPTKEWCVEKQATLKTLSWPERHNLYAILTNYNDHYLKKRLNYYYQEYMNEPLAPEAAIIKPDSFFSTEIQISYKAGMCLVSFFYEKLRWTGVFQANIGCDPASSTTTSSDDTAFTVFGYARCFPELEGYDADILREQYPAGRVFPVIAHIEGGKYADRNYGMLPGKAETLAMLVRKYKAQQVKIETNAQYIELFRTVDTYFKENNVQATVWGEASMTKKEDRILGIVLPIIQSYGVVICQKSDKLDLMYTQLVALGMGGHDDYADSLSIAAKNAEIPTTIYSGDLIHRAKTKTRIEWLKETFGDEWQYFKHLPINYQA